MKDLYYSQKCEIMDELFYKNCIQYPRCDRMSDMFKYDFRDGNFTMKCEAYTLTVMKDGFINVSTARNCGIGEYDIEFLSSILEIKDELLICLEENNILD